MNPIFDRSGQTVAWHEDNWILNPQGRHIAFLIDDAIHSLIGGVHLGWIDGKFIRDHEGRCVAFFEGADDGPPLPFSTFTPFQPMAHMPPNLPLPQHQKMRPKPLNSWSADGWIMFIS